METTNNYDVYSKYYDEVSHKRRDYPAIAKTISTFIGSRKTVLDIGAATGSVIEGLIQINPQQYEIWGIDNSAPLIEQAKAKLGSEDRVHFYVQDVLDLNLEQDFEFIYSRGGAFFFMYDPKENVFASHLLSREDNLKALKNIAKHLQESGLFVLSIVNFKAYMNTELQNGVIYYPRAERQTENGQEYLSINISFEKNDEVVDRQNLKLFLMDYDSSQEMFAEAGFEFLKTSPDGEYYMYTKK